MNYQTSVHVRMCALAHQHCYSVGLHDSGTVGGLSEHRDVVVQIYDVDYQVSGVLHGKEWTSLLQYMHLATYTHNYTAAIILQ